MATYADADLPTLYPGMTDNAADARALLGEARKAPLAKGMFGPMVLHHSDVTELLRDRRLRGPGMDLARLSGIPEGSRTWKRMEEILLFMEGDDHLRLRRLVSKAFTPRSVEALRPFTRATIATLLDAVIDDRACDAVAALCDPFPIPVICALIGIEADRWPDMSRWATSVLLSLRLDAGMFIEEIDQAQKELDEFITGLVADRRIDPRDDLLSNLIAAEEIGRASCRERVLASV